MELFKPYVNLTKTTATDTYTLNSVVSVPKGYALNSLTQSEIEKNGKKLWAVTATLTANDSPETDLAEFSVPLNQGPTEEIKTTSMIVVNAASMSNPIRDNSTDIDYDDAVGDLP